MSGPNCAGTDPESWFSTRPEDLAYCRRICADCDIRRTCLAGALARDEQFGVWGGVLFTRRWATAYPDRGEGCWRVSGRDVFGLPMRRGVFPSKEDARRHADLLLAISRLRRDYAKRARATRRAGSKIVGQAA